MIRKFEKNDINPVMQIWKNENIKAHKFISKEYWKNNYNYVKEILPNAEIYVYVLKENIVGFIGINENYIEGIFIDTNNQCKGIGTSLLNKVKENRTMNIKNVSITTIPNVTINYKKPKEEVEELKKVLGVKSYREVGEKTFEYYKDAEC